MTALGLALLAIAVAALARPAPSRRATVGELTSARLVAAARLRQFDEERQERFRRYHQAWAVSVARGRAPRRGYLLPFSVEARRG